MRKLIVTGILVAVAAVGLAAPAQARDTNWPCAGCIR